MMGDVWCGVVWCGVVWCGVVWCGVVWCGVDCPCASDVEATPQAQDRARIYLRFCVMGNECQCPKESELHVGTYVLSLTHPNLE